MIRNINSESKSMTDILKQKASRLCYCKSITNTMTEECNSEHVICQKCMMDQNTESKSNETIYVLKSRHHNIDLAGGDHRKSSLKDVSKIIGTDRMEIKYKNVNFKESHSDIDDEQDEIISDMDKKVLNYEVKEVTSKAGDVKLVQRPIKCPITECGRIMTLDSVSLHFYFDHSKIPRMPVANASAEIQLNISQISTKTRCFAVFSLQTQNKRSQATPPLLLMGAKYCTKTTTSAMKSTTSTESRNFSSKDVLVLWACKVADNVYNYSITIAREDRRLGHSYIGEAIHMKDNNDVKSVFTKAECLIVTGKAVDKIVETQDRLIVFVHILS